MNDTIKRRLEQIKAKAIEEQKSKSPPRKYRKVESKVGPYIKGTNSSADEKITRFINSRTLD